MVDLNLTKPHLLKHTSVDAILEPLASESSDSQLNVSDDRNCESSVSYVTQAECPRGAEDEPLQELETTFVDEDKYEAMLAPDCSPEVNHRRPRRIRSNTGPPGSFDAQRRKMCSGFVSDLLELPCSISQCSIDPDKTMAIEAPDIEKKEPGI